MNYSNRTYPHPVLGINDSIEDTFEVNLNVSADKGFIGINLEYNLSNKDLTKLIETRQAAFCMQLYCKGTLYREVFRSHKPLPQKIEIPSSRLHEQVDADFFICACDDYKNYTYLIEKGDILAYGGKGVFYANKSFEELKSVSAFMNIDSGDKKKMPMYNYYEGDKITVYLSQTSYELYQKIKNEKSYTDTLHSAVVLPALAEAIRFIDSDDASDYDEKKWFLLLSKLIESNATDDPMQTAQKILDHPVDRSFTSLYEIIR
jgi:hypothetical protein